MGVEAVGPAMRDVVAAMEGPGVVWAVVDPDRHTTIGSAGPLAADTIFRIASLTKPIVAVLTLRLAEQGRLDLDAPIDTHLPEFAGRRVLRAHGAPLEDTVAATRATTVRDLLQMGVGWGFDAAAGPDDPLQAALERDDLGSGWLPPELPPDRWAERAGALPMAHQPEQGWLYQYSFDALAVLLERATGQDLGRVLSEEVFEPLAMVDTGYTVDATALHRVPANVLANRAGRFVEATPAGDERLLTAPVFRSGATGLVSTAADLARFATMLLDRGRGPAGPLISAESWTALTTDTLGDAARQMMQEFVEDAGLGWGLGVGVDLTARFPGSTAGRFGWDGGTGTTLWVDPGAGVAGVLLSRQGFGAETPHVTRFWEAVFSRP